MRSVKKKLIAMILALCSVIVILGGCGGNSDEAKVKRRVNDFLKAFNEFDTRAIMECTDKGTRKNAGYMDLDADARGYILDELYACGEEVTAEIEGLVFPSKREALVRLLLTFQDTGNKLE